jgi:two-component system, NtrC family, response regulator HydG
MVSMGMKEKILIVEDQFIEANNLQMILERAGYRVCEVARSVPMALKIVDRERPDLVLLDIFLRGPLTGIDLARTLRERNIAFVFLSANSNKQTLDAAKATRPYGFLVKPFREKDVLVMLEIAHHLHEHSLESIVRSTPRQRTTPALAGQLFPGIIGQSECLRAVLHHLQLVAPSDTSVLVLGESGTGKERIAESIHERSPRSKKPLVKVNCAALPASLIESVLFGHERGAYTGATERRLGKFEQAHGGTIFLDEIGDMPLEVQVKLLRVLQEKEIERIGGHETIAVDLRVIAATNRDLEKEVAEGRFRMDLYYRLNVFPLVLPPLRERRDDIPLLIAHFVDHYATRMGKTIMPLSRELVADLMQHDWPGNIRELAHTLERAVLLAEDNRIRQVFIPRVREMASAAPSRIKTMEENERDHILAALRECNGKVFGKGGAADLLGLPASTLNSRMRKLGIGKETIFREKHG